MSIEKQLDDELSDLIDELSNLFATKISSGIHPAVIAKACVYFTAVITVKCVNELGFDLEPSLKECLENHIRELKNAISN